MNKLFVLTLLGTFTVVGYFNNPVANEARSQEMARPEVVTAVAPFFAGFIAGESATNKVVVEVTIDETGAVTSARTVEFSLTEDDYAEVAARQWRFKPLTGGVKNSKVNLTFVYKTLPAEAPYYEEVAIFKPPYQIEVSRINKKIDDFPKRVKRQRGARKPT